MISASARSPPQHATLVNAWIRLIVDYLSLNLSGFILYYYLVITGHLRTLMAVAETNERPLSKADEIAPRAYIREIFCFEFNDTPRTRRDAVKCVRDSMCEVVLKWPHLAGSITQDQQNLQKGTILLCQKPEDILNFSEEGLAVCEVDSEIFPWSYQQLRQQGFPLHTAANGNVFSQHPPLPDGSKPAPVFAVQLTFIEGGLIMSIYLHHSIGDGNCMGTLIDSLARCTRNIRCLSPETNPSTLRSSVFERSVINEFEEDWKQLLDQCPEYTLLPTPSGPFQPDLRHVKDDPFDEPTGKIISVPTERIQQLKCHCNRYLKDKYGSEAFVSANDCVGALLWAHTTNIRAQHFDELKAPNTLAHITVPVDYRRVMKPSLPQDYFGNAVALARASVPVSQLRNACFAHFSDPQSVGPLAETAYAFRKALFAVDDTYVRRRLALAHKIFDIRRLGLSANVELDVTYNTWANFGGDSVWNIPGTVPPPQPHTNGTPTANGAPSDMQVQGVKAEAIRRGHYEFNLVGHLTLPRRADSPVWEIIFQLRSSQMADILQDERFTRWIDRIVG